MLTACTFFGVVQLRSNVCTPITEGTPEAIVQYRCPEGKYNPLATLIFNTEGGTIRYLLSYPVTLRNQMTPD